MRFFILAILLLNALLLSAQSSLSLFEYEKTNTEDEIEERDILESKIATSNIDPLTFAESFNVKLNLVRGIDYTLTAKRLDRRHPVGNVDIYYGSTGDPAWAHLPHYRDVVIAVNRNSGKMVMHVFTSDGTFNVLPNADGTYTVAEEEAHNCSSDIRGNFTGGARNFMEPSKLMMTSGCDEQDENGDYVVDMYFGYSHQAASQIGDVLAYSIAQIETVNVGFQNSTIPDIYLRLVNFGISDLHIGVIGSSINLYHAHFSEDFAASGADMGAYYDSFFPGANNGGGFAFVPGRASVNAAGSGAVFRHEWGHNSGSRHCPTDGGGTAAYASGWNNGTNRTHMCGNSINFFSNPNLTDGDGTAIGDAATADNTRNITERRTVYSGYAKHIVPYDAADTGADCPLDFTEGRYTIQNAASLNYLSPIAAGVTNTKLDQATAIGVGEIWDLVHYKSNLFYIYNAESGRVLDVYGGSSTAGDNVGTWSVGSGNNNQLWRLEEQVSGNYTISPNGNSFCLQIPAGDTADGDLVIQDECDGTTDVEWILLPNAGSNNPPVTFIRSDTDATCAGSEDGTATVSPTGGSGTYTYSWASGGTAATETGLSAGNYVVTVTTGGRNYYTSVDVGGTAPLIPEYTFTHSTPTLGGTIDITNVQNAGVSTTYAWSDGGTGASRTDLAEGIYMVTITSDGCTKEQEIRIFEGLDVGTEYVIQHVNSGLYLQPREGSTGQSLAVILGDCPTDDGAYRWRADESWANVFRFRNQKAGSTNRYLTSRDRQTVGDSLRLTGWTSGNTENFVLTKTGVSTFTIRNNQNNAPLSVSGNNAGDYITQTDPDTGTADEFLFIPIVTCTPDASGAVCDDSDTTTDEDQVNLLCNCCGVPNECFGIGDADSDRNCTDLDCDDMDADIFIGSPCDDNDADSVGDALDINCNCDGRPITCTEVGAALDNVARLGTATARNFWPGSPTADVLIDGNRNGDWDNGEVWHSGANYSWANVELLQDELIKEITIYPRTDCCESRLNNVYVLVSDVPFSDSELSIAQLLTEADFAHQIPADYDSFTAYTLNVGIMGKHIRLKAPNSAMNLAEIEVRTCPQAAAVLPVDLLTFEGTVKAKTNDLFWETATEENNEGFTIQRSFDNRTFTDIGFVASVGNSESLQSYRFADVNPPTGIAYYRLLQSDFDGTEKYSQVINLTREDGKDWQVYPNPLGTGRVLTVRAEGETAFQLLSFDGKVLRNYMSGVSELSLRNLPAGVYLLRNRADGLAEKVLVY